MTAGLILLAAAAALAPEPVVDTVRRVESPTSTQTAQQIVVPASQSDVWKAVSTSEGWRGWAAAQAWQSDDAAQVIETSYDPKGSPGAASNIKSQILLRVPERLVAFRTIKAPEGFADFDALAAVTWVIELEPTGGGTIVRITGSGFPRTAAGERIQNFFLDHNPIALRALRDRFEPAGAGKSAQR